MNEPAAKLRLAVLASGSGRTLQNLLDLERADLSFPAAVAVVIGTKRGCGALDRAQRAELPGLLVERRAFSDDGRFSKALFEAIAPSRPDLVCFAGLIHRVVIPPEFAGRVMNIHPALLPSFGGKGFYGERVHQAVIDCGAKLSGCTVHFCDNDYDRGPLIVQLPVPVHEDDTPESLAARVFAVECLAYPQAIRLFAEKRLVIDGARVRVLPQAPASPAAPGRGSATP